MQMDAKYKAVKQTRCMTRVITALRSPINNTVSSRCDSWSCITLLPPILWVGGRFFYGMLFSEKGRNSRPFL